jgi:hypothetical protein
MMKKLALLMVLGPLIMTAQQGVNFSNTTPAAQPGYQAVTFQTSFVSPTRYISAEVPTPVFTSLYGSGAPSLPCSATVNWTMFYTNLSATPQFTLYQCLDGLSGYAWYPVGGNGSGGSISGLTAGYVPLAGSSTSLTGNSPLDYGVTTASWLTSSAPFAVPKIAVGTSTTPTLFQVTGQTVATLPAASLYPPVTSGSVTNYWQTEVTDAVSYANCTSGGGSIVMWCWSNGTTWQPGLPSVIGTPRTCNSNGCYWIAADGTITETISSPTTLGGSGSPYVATLPHNITNLLGIACAPSYCVPGSSCSVGGAFYSGGFGITAWSSSSITMYVDGTGWALVCTVTAD